MKKLILFVIVVAMLVATITACAPAPASGEELPNYLSKWAPAAAMADFQAVLVAGLILLPILLSIFLCYIGRRIWRRR